MASDVKSMTGGEKSVVEENAPLALESVWIQQPSFEDAEKKFVKLSLHEESDGSEISRSTDVSSLAQETVWFKQQQFESAETLYHMFLTASGDSNVTPGTPGKRHHVQDNRPQSKKQKSDRATSDLWNKKFKSEGASLLKTAKTAQGRLEELEKIQQRKSQIIKDAASRLAAALEECQTRLTDELAQSAGQINVFRSLLTEIEPIVDKATNSLAEKKWGHFRTQEKYCEKMADRLLKLGKDLNSCIDLCNCFQADISKSDINRIVGEIGKLSLIKKHWDGDQFMRKKTVIANNIKSLVDSVDGTAATPLSDSESSLEGSCTDPSDDSETGPDGTEKNLKPHLGRADKSKKAFQNTKKSNRNNANANKDGRNKAKTDSLTGRPNSGQNVPAAVKRNAQGIQSAVDKRPDLFQFKGVSRPSSVPFVSQPGLLGPRPNVFSLQGGNTQIPFRFSQFGTTGRKQQPLPNFGTVHNPLSAVNQPGFGNMNFNFPGAQPRPSSLDFVPNSVLASMNQQARSQMKQYQIQDQTKGAKKSDYFMGAKAGFAYPRQQGTGRPGFLQNPQTGQMGYHPSRGSLEQQLNEMAQKIQQMQLATSQNHQLQQLMQETQRLKQLVAQKQHQEHDRFQHQFQLLINAFMQQQRQQQFQGPQSKMARAVQFQNDQKQQQLNRHQQLQQQKKRKQQQNKVQQVKMEPQKQLPKEDAETEKAKRESLFEKSPETVLQNGADSFTKEGDKKIISKNSKVTKIGTFSPQAQGDKHKAGVSSLVVMEDIDSVVVVDIINSCLKLYTVTKTNGASAGLSHQLVTRLELSRPYYLSRLNKDTIVMSREGKLLSLVKVSKKRLEFLQDIKTESQYYGLNYVRDDVIVCAAFTDNRIDLVSIQDGVAQTAVLLTQCNGPELVAAVPSTGCILYLERVLNKTVNLVGISQLGVVEFSIDLESSPTDVWSVASFSNRIVCCNKQSGKVKLFTDSGIFLTDIIFPPGTVNQPFAIAFCDSGRMYIANDGAWDNEYEHYITTDIIVYSFS